MAHFSSQDAISPGGGWPPGHEGLLPNSSGQEEGKVH